MDAAFLRDSRYILAAAFGTPISQPRIVRRKHVRTTAIRRASAHRSTRLRPLRRVLPRPDRPPRIPGACERARDRRISALAMAQSLFPRYADAQTISFTDSRIKAKYVDYPSPGGNSGKMRGYLVQPSGHGQVSVCARDPREPRSESVRRGRRTSRGRCGFRRARARRAGARRRLSR